MLASRFRPKKPSRARRGEGALSVGVVDVLSRSAEAGVMGKSMGRSEDRKGVVSPAPAAEVEAVRGVAAIVAGEKAFGVLLLLSSHSSAAAGSSTSTSSSCCCCASFSALRFSRLALRTSCWPACSRKLAPRVPSTTFSLLCRSLFISAGLRGRCVNSSSVSPSPLSVPAAAAAAAAATRSSCSRSVKPLAVLAMLSGRREVGVGVGSKRSDSTQPDTGDV